MNTLMNVFQPPFSEILNIDYHLKSKWQETVFKNNNPIVLELGCGKGEYAVGLAKKFPDKNFIGIDIKGARMWIGAKEANDKQLSNVAFIRTRIELINSFFAENEVSEIWITFPDPQIKRSRNKKRLTSSRFLNSYKRFLKQDGTIHLKTDSSEMYEYTQKIISVNKLENTFHTNDLYNSELKDDILGIRTYYEQIYLNVGKKITYTKFKINTSSAIVEISNEE